MKIKTTNRRRKTNKYKARSKKTYKKRGGFGNFFNSQQPQSQPPPPPPILQPVPSSNPNLNQNQNQKLCVISPNTNELTIKLLNIIIQSNNRLINEIKSKQKELNNLISEIIIIIFKGIFTGRPDDVVINIQNLIDTKFNKRGGGLGFIANSLLNGASMMSGINIKNPLFDSAFMVKNISVIINKSCDNNIGILKNNISNLEQIKSNMTTLSLKGRVPNNKITESSNGLQKVLEIINNSKNNQNIKYTMATLIPSIVKNITSIIPSNKIVPYGLDILKTQKIPPEIMNNLSNILDSVSKNVVTVILNYFQYTDIMKSINTQELQSYQDSANCKVGTV